MTLRMVAGPAGALCVDDGGDGAPAVLFVHSLAGRADHWSAALERFNNMSGDVMHFTEQTIIHLGLQAAGARALPAEKYVLANDDQWLWRDLHAGPQVALRHYISSFRHKFWLKVRY